MDIAGSGLSQDHPALARCELASADHHFDVMDVKGAEVRFELVMIRLRPELFHPPVDPVDAPFDLARCCPHVLDPAHGFSVPDVNRKPGLR